MSTNVLLVRSWSRHVFGEVRVSDSEPKTKAGTTRYDWTLLAPTKQITVSDTSDLLLPVGRPSMFASGT